MSTLTIKNLPDALHRRLKEMAERNRRSLNSEVIHLLERSLDAAPVDPRSLLVRARAVREKADLPYLTDAALRAARDDGRA